MSEAQQDRLITHLMLLSDLEYASDFKGLEEYLANFNGDAKSRLIWMFSTGYACGRVSRAERESFKKRNQ